MDAPRSTEKRLRRRRWASPQYGRDHNQSGEHTNGSSAHAREHLSPAASLRHAPNPGSQQEPAHTHHHKEN